MLLISNNVQKYMEIPDDAVIRVNMAWVPTIDILEEILQKNKDKIIFLDYPEGRAKPPKPILTLSDAYLMCQKYLNIKYFAVSNVESVARVLEIKNNLPLHVDFVPKIETLKGITNLHNLISTANVTTIMLDKEDLYTDVGKQNTSFFKCVDLAREICKELDVTLLELEGVVFSNRRI